MNNEALELIRKSELFVKEQLSLAESGHDWWHILRVKNLAIPLALQSGADELVVTLAALLHDTGDSKFNGGDEEAGPTIIHAFLSANCKNSEVVEHVMFIIRHMSFKHSFGFDKAKSIEFQVVQDADRLDAIGAIGISRAFSYGGYKGMPFYDPDVQPQQFSSGNAYKNAKTPTINHFYEKLLLLKDQMNTAAAKKMAEERHQYMLDFLDQFLAEWKGER